MLDAIIIGAGPAGCVAAILLARAGLQVTLVEQHRYPRDKACGECISALGMAVARRIGVADQLRRLSAVELSRSILIAPDGQAAEMLLPEPMWGLSRSALDYLLLETARAAGAVILQPARCEHVAPGCMPTVTVRSLETNTVRTIPTNLVLQCDGKGRGKTNDLGLKAHFDNIRAADAAITLYGVSGHYVGVAPIEQNRWNLAMSVPLRRIAQHQGGHDGMLDELRRENVALDRAFQAAQRMGPWLCAPLPRYGVAPAWPEGIIPLGNAAAAIDPIGGEGIGLAMRSAEIAATEIIEATHGNRAIDLQWLRAEFRKLWRFRSLGCRAAALAVSRPVFARIAAPIFQNTPALRRVALCMTGKLE